MAEKLSKEKIEEIATITKCVLDTLDIFIPHLNTDELDQLVVDMKNDVIHRDTLSIITGHSNNSELVAERTDVYEAMVNLIKARKKQLEFEIKRSQAGPDPRKILDEQLNAPFNKKNDSKE